jgi:ABC-type glycerol-3-phosphate transport system substrate-binding protein
MRPRTLIAILASIAALGVAGCGDREQVVQYKQGKYQGKPDSQPWDSDSSTSLHTTSSWNKGDRTSWETAIKQRQLNQNEYVRTQ